MGGKPYRFHEKEKLWRRLGVPALKPGDQALGAVHPRPQSVVAGVGGTDMACLGLGRRGVGMAEVQAGVGADAREEARDEVEIPRHGWGDLVVEHQEELAPELVGLGEDGGRRGGEVADGEIVSHRVRLGDQGRKIVSGSCRPADEGRGLGR